MLSRLRKIFTEYKELRYLAYHDSLTGLLNRNWLYKNIETINRKYVYFIDINDLRSINTLGHTFGDKYIIKCVKAIKHSKDDYLIRYAGDEFILISNNFDLVKTNDLFSVGMDLIGFNLSDAINIADSRMIKSKKEFKQH